MELKRKIEEIVLKTLDDDLFIVDIIISGGESAQKIQVLVDGDEGIDIDKCAEISRAVGGEIEEGALIEHAYILEVSSPGLDYPLQDIRQYKKNIGRRVKISLNNSKTIKGKLLNVNDGKIKVGEEKITKIKGKSPDIEEIEIDLKEIKKTSVLASFK